MSKFKKVLVGFLVLVMCFGFCSCGSESSGEKEYVKPEEIQKVYANPKEYKGKYIKVSGRIFSDVEQDGDDYVFQMFQDLKNSKNNTFVTTKDSVSEDEYVIVEGRIKGEKSGPIF